jgi:hypothetical protein
VISRLTGIRSLSLEFRLAIAISLICPILYFLSPEDGSPEFPSLYASRYLWTDFIPLSISVFVLLATYQSLMGKFSIFETKAVSILILFLIFMSVQFATTSPVGVDGWFFLENAQYFSIFGESGRAIYDSHPLVFIPVDFHIRIFGSDGRNIAMIMGMIMSLYWINTIASAVSSSTNFRRTGVLIFSAMGLYFIVTGWYPLRYSAHLLALTLGHYLVHKESKKTSIADLGVAFFLAISHPFSPLVFGCMFFVDAFSRRDRARRSQALYLLISLTFLVYNLDGLTSRFENYGISILSSENVRYLLFSVPLIFFSMQILVERIWEPREDGLIKTGSGISNVSVLIGCIIAIPFLLVADNQTGASRFTHRLVTYSIVPLLFVLDYCFYRIIEEFRKVTKAKVFNFTVSMVCIINGFGVAILHDAHVRSAEVMPENMTECWDMVEDTGALAIIENNHEKGYGIIISDQTHPPVSNLFYYNFLKTGDGSRIGDTDSQSLIGMLETPGMFDKISTYQHFSTENFVVVGEVNGACRLWIDSDLKSELNSENPTTWKRLDSY